MLDTGPDTIHHAEAPDSNTSRAGVPPEIARRKWPRRAAIMAALLVVAVAGYAYQHYRGLHPRTGDAYLNAHVVRIAPQITGRVLRVLVTNNQHVEQNQLLLEIDPAPFAIELEQAQAQLNLATQEEAAAQSAVGAARAEVTPQQAVLKNVTSETTRTLALVDKGNLPKASGDDAQANLQEAQQALLPLVEARGRKFILQQYLCKRASATAEFKNGLRCWRGGMCAHRRDGHIFVPALLVLFRTALIVKSARFLMVQRTVHWGSA